MTLDRVQCARAVASRDPRFDGWFVWAAPSADVYCRPTCPGAAAAGADRRYFPSTAGAQAAGLRSCPRCRPDSAPGPPAWAGRDDLVGRAMRLIADGTIDRIGVDGLADRLGTSRRHLQRALVDEVGAGPEAIGRAQRAALAMLLVETTDLPFAEVATAAGFGSVRQGTDVFRAVFGRTPTQARSHRPPGLHPGLRISPSVAEPRAAPAPIHLRLPYRRPFDGPSLLAFLGARAVPGVEEVAADGTYRRTLDLPHGWATVELAPTEVDVRCTLRLSDRRDLAAAVARCRRLLDLDADPVLVDDVLGADPLLVPLVAARPGLRVPGAVDGPELAIRAVLGQQVSVAAARTLAGRLTTALGIALPAADGSLTHLFPRADALATAPDHLLPMPASRRRALRGLAAAIADGTIVLDAGSDRTTTREQLLHLPGIGPWTASYIELRVLGHRDAFLPSDLGVRHALAALGVDPDLPSVAACSAQWQPLRAYANLHLWTSLS